ncbi:MAG: hypothetical protein P8M78_03595 [Myxococcota bacterium]|jgi:hypothetical protein|nr:hypothetical protein [Myxococcota bacterium]
MQRCREVRVSGASREPERGSIVTYAVAIFMLVALLLYLVVAFFYEDPSTTKAPESSTATSVDPRLLEDPGAPESD